MYLPPYSTPSDKTSVQSYSPEKGKPFVDVPENVERVWTIIHNPTDVPVGVSLGRFDNVSFSVGPGEDKVLPSPSYLGVIRCRGSVVITELLKNA